ncbi:MAG: hypothetical protein JWQ09_1794 [Segetibacter sp.]|nr:hypothetical protein [Segetibacter sp.]
MDKISDFFKELKDRASNPFISSFIISWLIINYKVPVAWVFYNNEALKEFHKSNHIDFLTNSVTNLTGWILPLLAASLYTFAWPYAKAFIKKYHAKINAKTEDEILKITSTSSISLSAYFETSKKLVEREKQFSEISGNTQEIQKRMDEQAKSLTSMGHANEDLKNKIALFTRFNDVSSINGIWLIVKTLGNGEGNINGSVNIHFGTIDKTHAAGSTEPVFIGQINNFIGSPSSKTITFTIAGNDDNEIFKKDEVLFLQVNEKFDSLKGVDNFGNQYSFEKR